MAVSAATDPDLAGLPEVAGVSHRCVEANGARIHLAEAGEGDPVLLLHGWPQHWWMWRRVILGLGDRYRLLAPDLRGFGWSETPGHGYDPETFARDQIAMLDELGIERVHVVGHDWGGFTAFVLGLDYPHRIGRVLALNSPHPWPRVRPRLLADTWRSWYAAAMALPGIGRAAVGRGVPRNVLTRGNTDQPFTEEDLDVYLNQFRDRARAGATTSLYRWYMGAFARLGRPYARKRLTAPTLLLFGQRDRYVSPLLLEGHEGHAEDMRVELVPDCGHFIVDEKPELVATRAREHLGSD